MCVAGGRSVTEAQRAEKLSYSTENWPVGTVGVGCCPGCIQHTRGHLSRWLAWTTLHVPWTKSSGRTRHQDLSSHSLLIRFIYLFFPVMCFSFTVVFFVLWVYCILSVEYRYSILYFFTAVCYKKQVVISIYFLAYSSTKMKFSNYNALNAVFELLFCSVT